MPTSPNPTMSPSSSPKPPYPFFNLPAELRLAIYDHLEFPPLNNSSYGFIFSCRKAKGECEEAASKQNQLLLEHIKSNVLPKVAYRIQLVVPPQPSGPHQFHTLREITLVLPGNTYIVDDIHLKYPRQVQKSLYGDLRRLSPIFALWLDKLKLRFQDAEKHWLVKWYDCWDEEYFEDTFQKLMGILDRGFVYGNNPLLFEKDFQQEEEGEERASESALRFLTWKPGEVNIKEIVVAWELDGGLDSDEVVEMEGTCNKDPMGVERCAGPGWYAVKDYRNGEIGRKSTCRFRWPQHEEWGPWPVDRHKAECGKCNWVWSYKREMRGLPIPKQSSL